ncbi:hypothetical protein ISN45_Aa05g008530 [Arabidopsis thaliana x Arabidopsis arenosa]|uniref:Uncharacterized protein n=1 Tax=Arabidopsis thaliana x Arabidopsis arenosa TaxID=1240361 RepID=A0A8T1ZLB4_9BRAS|nr:hypothetical protein ISN45_Aa05g008530 [Arabidopsis thaliana x Arabidopsis arenosa]
MQGIYNYTWKSNSGMTKSNTLNQTMVASRPKKRKSSIFLQSPWHKVYLQGSELCHSIRIAEQEWGLATNTLSEKVDTNEAISPSKRRLALSTHLMQQLLQPAPAFVFLGENAALNYEIVLYFVSRITLADSCSLKCHSNLNKSINLERTTSILDIIFEIQDLERFSVINHLGKFHNRAKTITRPIPQRYVVGIQMPMKLPEPLYCLPL